MADIAETLGSIAAQAVKIGAPILGGVLTGGAGPLAGIALSTLANALGADATPQSVSDALEKLPPEVAQEKLKLAEKQLQTTQDALQAQLADVQSARAQTIALAKDNSPIAWGAPLISFVVVSGFTFLCIAMFFWPPPENSTTNLLFGAMISAFTAVISYWLGSSAGSHAKTAEMSGIVKGLVSQAARREKNA